MNQDKIARIFIFSSLISLLAGIIFGLIGTCQYIWPELFNPSLSFNKVRPLHVTLVIAWIFNSAIGSIYYFLPGITNGKVYSVRITGIHLSLFLFSTTGIVICYFMSVFGGREYLEYPPVFAIPITASWILFGINFFKSIYGKVKIWPVYLWMWSTGIIFFLITYIESYLWIIPYFGNNIIRDITIQWKSLGAMVGSWNMLVYGIAFYIMEKMSKNKKLALEPKTFFFYFLGLTNLMFNWGHHTYIVPAANYIKQISYIISMTELLILGSIIYNWKRTLESARKYYFLLPYRFMIASDIWIFLNLTLAILISIPGINFFTHGTHITVAHAMGTTIGINSMILFSSIYFIINSNYKNNIKRNSKLLSFGFWLTNISLFLFWISLIFPGIIKGYFIRSSDLTAVITIESLLPYLHSFLFSGFLLLAGLTLLTFYAVSGILVKKTTKKISIE